jgi:hypothetical protein
MTRAGASPAWGMKGGGLKQFRAFKPLKAGNKMAPAAKDPLSLYPEMPSLYIEI